MNVTPEQAARAAAEQYEPIRFAELPTPHDLFVRAFLAGWNERDKQERPDWPEFVVAAFNEGFAAGGYMAGTLSVKECWDDSHAKEELARDFKSTGRTTGSPEAEAVKS